MILKRATVDNISINHLKPCYYEPMQEHLKFNFSIKHLQKTSFSPASFKFTLDESDTNSDDSIIYNMNELQSRHSENWNKLINSVPNPDLIQQTFFSNNLIIGLAIAAFIFSFLSIIIVCIIMKLVIVKLANRTSIVARNQLFAKPVISLQLNFHYKFSVSLKMFEEVFNFTYCGETLTVASDSILIDGRKLTLYSDILV